MRRLMLVPYTFVLMNWAAMKALWFFLRGDGPDRVWTDPRGAGHARRRAFGPSKP